MRISFNPSLLLLLLLTLSASASDDALDNALDKMGSAFLERNVEVLAEIFSTDEFIRRIQAKLSFSERVNESVVAGVRSSIPVVQQNLITSLVDCHLTITRIIEAAQSAKILTRCEYDDSLSYVEFELHREDDGPYQLIDWYDYTKGDHVTSSMAQNLALLLVQQGHSMRLMGLDLAPQIRRDYLHLLTLNSDGSNIEGWEEAYNKLPASLRFSRHLLVERVQITAAGQNEQYYRDALSDLEKHHGHDPRLTLILIDHYYFTDDSAALKEAFDRLNLLLGGDAALLTLKADVLKENKEYDEAAATVREALEIEPGYLNAYLSWLDISVKQENYTKAVTMIERMEKTFDLSFSKEELDQWSGEFKLFTASEAFINYQHRKAAD